MISLLERTVRDFVELDFGFQISEFVVENNGCRSKHEVCVFEVHSARVTRPDCLLKSIRRKRDAIERDTKIRKKTKRKKMLRRCVNLLFKK